MCPDIIRYVWWTLTPELDMSLSKDLTDQFKERMNQSHDDMDITFSIMVLGTNFWPLNAPNNDFVIPAEILPTYDRFQKYYQVKHSGRKLTWLWNYSKNELRTNYLNQKYIFMTSSYQMAVLLQYNKNDTLSLDELVAATAISKDILVQVLALLVKAKVLINEETDQYDLNPSAFYRYLTGGFSEISYFQISSPKRFASISTCLSKQKSKQNHPTS